MSDEFHTKTWAEQGFDKPATTEEVHDVFPNFDGPVCKGTLKQISDLTEVQWDSDEVWETLNSTNEDALREGGFEGEVLKFSRTDAEEAA